MRSWKAKAAYVAVPAALAAVQSELSISLRKDHDPDIYQLEMATFLKLFR